jgi:hypothetical protein
VRRKARIALTLEFFSQFCDIKNGDFLPPKIAKLVNLTLAKTYFSKISPNVLSKKAHDLLKKKITGPPQATMLSVV